MLNNITYKLNFSIDSCSVQVKINDILVLDHKTGSMSAEKPINQWLIPGINIINVSINPINENFQLSSSVKLSIDKFDKIDANIIDLDSRKAILEFATEDNIENQSTPIKYMNSFASNLSFRNPPSWIKGKTVKPVIEDLELFYGYVEKIYNLFYDQKVDEICKEFRLKAMEYDEAYGKPSGFFLQDFKTQLEECYADPNGYLINFLPEKLVPVFHGAGRLIEFKYEKGDMSLIVFGSTEVAITTHFPIYFSLSEKNEVYISK